MLKLDPYPPSIAAERYALMLTLIALNPAKAIALMQVPPDAFKRWWEIQLEDNQKEVQNALR